MGRRVIALVAAIVGMGTAMSAQAQLKPETQTGSLIADQPHGLDAKQAGIVRKQFAQCVFQSAKPKALALLEHSDTATIDLQGSGIKNVVKDLNMERCLGEQVLIDERALGMKFGHDVLRDLMAEEAYLAKNSVAPRLAADASPLKLNIVSTGSQLIMAQELATFGDCAIRRDVAGADALLRTMPGGEAERGAAAALAPALGACLVAGQTVTLKPANIRALVAHAMWSRFGR